MIVQLHSKGKARYERKNKQLYAIVFYVSVAVSALICLLAEPIVGILYGGAYLSAVMPLRIVTWYTAFASLVTQVSTTMVLPFAISPLRPNAMLMLDAILL